ncbi:putative uncharacterized protein [Methylocaldum marinum]|jgi:hypothetical protein|uniref:Uncharacterized protein n=1 Tax=Methylocaldum marinum TaxID=1432792 RepID=A0A250KZ86_9GAMM|nr:putative uncharacterized protein [Methylocaldum marinum]
MASEVGPRKMPRQNARQHAEQQDAGGARVPQPDTNQNPLNQCGTDNTVNDAFDSVPRHME